MGLGGRRHDDVQPLPPGLGGRPARAEAGSGAGKQLAAFAFFALPGRFLPPGYLADLPSPAIPLLWRVFEVPIIRDTQK